MTDAERRALTQEYRQRNGEKPDSAISLQRLKEFLQTFTPEGAMALHRSRQAENKALYGGLGQAEVTPPVPTQTPIPYRPPPGESAERIGQPIRPASSDFKPDDDLPEFDTF